LEPLRRLWQLEQLPVEPLGKRITEFQVVEGVDRQLLGGIGLHIEANQGWLHSEVYAQPELEADIQPLLWERLQVVAKNHGLIRLWTREFSPFWRENAFLDAPADVLPQLPTSFGTPDTGWRTLQLSEERPGISVEREFEWFRQQQAESTDQLMRHARLWRWVATLLAIVLLGFVMAGIIYVVYHLRPSRLP
jgi:hypothetical protein